MGRVRNPDPLLDRVPGLAVLVVFLVGQRDFSAIKLAVPSLSVHAGTERPLFSLVHFFAWFNFSSCICSSSGGSLAAKFFLSRPIFSTCSLFGTL